MNEYVKRSGDFYFGREGELLSERSREQRVTENEAPDGLQGLSKAMVAAGKIKAFAWALFLLALVIVGPLSLMFFMRSNAASAEARRVAAIAEATEVALSIPTVTVTSLPVLDYSRPVFPTPMGYAGDPVPSAVAQAQSEGTGSRAVACVMRHPYIYDSGSVVDVISCGDQFCTDVSGNLIPKNYIGCGGEYPAGAVFLPTSTPPPPATATPVVKWRTVEVTAECPVCPVCPECPVPTAPAVLASDQIELCWRIDGIKALWIDGQGVAGHDCQVFAVPFDGGNEAIRGLEIKVQR